MTDPTPEINSAFDDARESERELRDKSIRDEIDTTDRIARNLGEDEQT